MRRLITLMILAALAAPSVEGQSSRGALARGTIAITSVNVVPMTRDTVIRDATVIVRDGRIAADFDLAELNLPGFTAFNHRLTIENGSERVNKASSGHELVAQPPPANLYCRLPQALMLCCFCRLRAAVSGFAVLAAHHFSSAGRPRE